MTIKTHARWETGKDASDYVLPQDEALALLERNVLLLLKKWKPEKVARRMDLSEAYVLEVAARQAPDPRG
jgi:hypothetical protein